jgi:hypothetical protein
VHVPPTVEYEARAFDEDEIPKLLAAMRGHRYEVQPPLMPKGVEHLKMCTHSAVTGMRAAASDAERR